MFKFLFVLTGFISAIAIYLVIKSYFFTENSLPGTQIKNTANTLDIDVSTPTESESIDFEKFLYNALTMPLEEAGKQITDKDLARYYYKLLQNSGWNIKQE
ncbi:MAG: hypothetical protein NTV30_10630 [Chloroflexi bacterium]|nr:hypothetical protein [Chloroflexota bacterium]